MDNYETPKAVKELKTFLEELSKWYIRRSRDRFSSDDTVAFDTLYYVLVEFTKLAAPIAPFTSEKIYRDLVGTQFAELPESVHLCNYPVADTNFLSQHSNLLSEMQLVRQITELGQTLRASEGLKVRQPLAKLEVEFSTERDSQGAYLADWMKELVCDELNVMEVQEVPRLTENEHTKVAGESTSGVRVGLDTQITPELAKAGLLRELIRSIQALRKQAGMQIGEEVNVIYQTDSAELLDLFNSKKEELVQAVTARELSPGELDSEPVKVNEHEVRLKVDVVGQ